MTTVIIANYRICFNKNKIETQIEKIFQDEKRKSKKDQELKKRSTKARMNLEAITKLINHLDTTPITSLRKCAQAINVNVSTLIRSLLNVAKQKWKSGTSYWKINLDHWVDWYVNFSTRNQQRWRNWIRTKWNQVLSLIKHNYQSWFQLKWLSGQLIRYQLDQIYDGKIPALRTLYNWFNKPILGDLKQWLIFKKGYKKVKEVKEPKRPKAVFNAHWKTHEDYLKIVDQPNIYQLDTISGKKKDLYWLVLLTNLQTGQPYIKRCLKNKRAVRNALKAIIRKYHLQIDHLLMDNGWENILLDQVDPNINLYHCDPSSPWQKSNVERTIRDLRTYPLLAKHRSLDPVDQKEVNQIIFHYWNYRQFLHK